MSAMHRAGALMLLLVAACRTTLPATEYVPGGAAGLSADTRALYRRAVNLERAGQSKEALAALGELTQANPSRLGFHLRRLRLARASDGPDAAAALYEPAPPGLDPDVAAILARLGRLSDDDVAGRQAVLETATALQPREPYWRLAVADVLLRAFELIYARMQEERALGRVQDAAESFAEAERTLAEAQVEAQTALDYDGGFQEAYLLLGFLSTRHADLAEGRDQRDAWRIDARDRYEAARDLDPQSITARINLAENYLYFADHAQAARELEVAAHLSPKDPRVWNNLGLAHYSLGSIERAIEHYRTALRLQPKSARTRAALSDCLRRADRPDDALRELRRARADAGEDIELRAEIAFKLAAIYEHEGRYRDALREYERHIELGGADAAKAKSRIRRIYEGAYEPGGR
jgi:tetratricopeptide (TPR) repeat protein